MRLSLLENGILNCPKKEGKGPESFDRVWTTQGRNDRICTPITSGNALFDWSSFQRYSRKFDGDLGPDMKPDCHSFHVSTCLRKLTVNCYNAALNWQRRTEYAQHRLRNDLEVRREQIASVPAPPNAALSIRQFLQSSVCLVSYVVRNPCVGR